jgi:autotransporter-associated beta strand protein
VLLGGLQTCAIGANSKNTTFAGIIKDGDLFGAAGAVAKVGVGSLTLTGANTYTGGTTVSSGTLVVNNTTSSATGSGAVQANAGTLGGHGIIAGAVTIGTGSGPGAFLAPSVTLIRASRLTILDSITFKADSTYVWRAHPERITADQVNARGVTIEDGATFSAVVGGNATIAPGTIFTLLRNNGPQLIIGTFSNLTDGGTITVGSNTFQANYEGGDGNDLTLTVVP